jgi:hypothetical protein
MRKISMTTRNELLTALGERYRRCVREEKGRNLDEFVAVSGYHRKHAMPLLRSGAATKAKASNRRQIYDEAVRTALVVLWKPPTGFAASAFVRSFLSCWKRWSDMAISIWLRRFELVCLP